MKMHTAYAVVDREERYIGSREVKRQAESLCRYSQGDRVARVEIREVNADEITDSELIDALESLPYCVSVTVDMSGPKTDGSPSLRSQLAYFVQEVKNAD